MRLTHLFAAAALAAATNPAASLSLTRARPARAHQNAGGDDATAAPARKSHAATLVIAGVAAAAVVAGAVALGSSHHHTAMPASN